MSRADRGQGSLRAAPARDKLNPYAVWVSTEGVEVQERMRARDPVGLGMGLFLALALPRAVEATVAEQRARLPPPADCADPVTGTWKALTWRPRYDDWNDWTLEVRRVPEDPTRLRGTILNHSWYGPSTQSAPPPCAGERELTIGMDAEGTLEGDLIHFYAVGQWRLEAAHCGEMELGYNLDHFSGTIDHTLHEFQSVNNDGGTAVNEPVVFRRVRCEDAPPRVFTPVAPPPFYPPGSGCLDL